MEFKENGNLMAFAGASVAPAPASAPATSPANVASAAVQAASTSSRTLSGATDVIVIVHPNGARLGTPFHVRFGRLAVGSDRESMPVTVVVNGRVLPWAMHLTRDGSAKWARDPIQGTLQLLPTSGQGAAGGQSPPAPPLPPRPRMRDRVRQFIAPKSDGSRSPPEPTVQASITQDPPGSATLSSQSWSEWMQRLRSRRRLSDVGQRSAALSRSYSDPPQSTSLSLKTPATVSPTDMPISLSPKSSTSPSSGGPPWAISPRYASANADSSRQSPPQDVPLKLFSQPPSPEQCPADNVDAVPPIQCAPVLTASAEAIDSDQDAHLHDCDKFSSSSFSGSDAGDGGDGKEGVETRLPEPKTPPAPQSPAATSTFTSSNGPVPGAGAILSSVELDLLPLVEGLNTVEYHVCDRRSGRRYAQHARIFMWPAKSKIVVSDVDGTITRSDALGLLLPALFGSQYAHDGIAPLYAAIARRGYHFVYLTSRGIAQADATRGYIRSVRQPNASGLGLGGSGGSIDPLTLEIDAMPDGPVLTSPDSLFAALRREVVHRTPQQFKIATLAQIAALFRSPSLKPTVPTSDLLGLGTDFGGSGGGAQSWSRSPSTSPGELPSCPFVAGFGNRETDSIAYAAVGIPQTHLFCVNGAGEISVMRQPGALVDVEEPVQAAGALPPALAPGGFTAPPQDSPTVAAPGTAPAGATGLRSHPSLTRRFGAALAKAASRWTAPTQPPLLPSRPDSTQPGDGGDVSSAEPANGARSIPSEAADDAAVAADVMHRRAASSPPLLPSNYVNPVDPVAPLATPAPPPPPILPRRASVGAALTSLPPQPQQLPMSYVTLLRQVERMFPDLERQTEMRVFTASAPVASPSPPLNSANENSATSVLNEVQG